MDITLDQANKIVAAAFSVPPRRAINRWPWW